MATLMFLSPQASNIEDSNSDRLAFDPCEMLDCRWRAYRSAIHVPPLALSRTLATLHDRHGFTVRFSLRSLWGVLQSANAALIWIAFRVNVIPAPLRLFLINTVATHAKLADRLPNNQVDTGTEVTPVQHLMVMRVAVQLEVDIKAHRPTKSALNGSWSFKIARRSFMYSC